MQNVAPNRECCSTLLPLLPDAAAPAAAAPAAAVQFRLMEAERDFTHTEVVQLKAAQDEARTHNRVRRLQQRRPHGGWCRHRWCLPVADKLHCGGAMLLRVGAALPSHDAPNPMHAMQRNPKRHHA